MTSPSLVSAQQRARILTEQHSDRAYLMPVGDTLSAVFIGGGPPRKLIISADGSVIARYIYLPPVGHVTAAWVYQEPLPGDDAGVGSLDETVVDLALTTPQIDAINRLGKQTEFLPFGFAREGDGVLVLYPDKGVLSSLRISDSGIMESALVG